MTGAQSIVAHYRAKGLTGPELRAAIARHARLLEPLDPGMADALEDEPLRANDYTIGRRR
jgi:hypothetical protein